MVISSGDANYVQYFDFPEKMISSGYINLL